MKKLLPFVLILIFGCGPKMASKDTIDRLEEARISCESAEAKAKGLEAKRIMLEEELARKKAVLEELQKELGKKKGEE